MAKSIAAQILGLQEMTVPELQAEYQEVFGVVSDLSDVGHV